MIIQLLTEEGIRNLQESILALVIKGDGFADVVAKVKEQTDALGREICKQIFESLDESIYQDPKRKKDWYVERKAESKKIITHLGEIEYKRSYYRSRKGKGYRHLLDELLGIDVHERIDQGVRADMTEHAANVSYQKAGELACDVKISRQTVMNGVHKLKELKVESLGAEHKGIETLYIDADEDHISLQSGKKAMPRLIYIHEGIKKSGGRNELINPFYFASLRKNPDALWQEVYEHVEDTYNTDIIKTVYISGDGAAWIKKGLEYFPKAKFVLDRYHMNKYVIKATANNREYRSRIWEALNLSDLKALKKVMKELYDETESERKRKEIRESFLYFKNNWDGIETYGKERESIVGCSAEGHNSHILADRMSSRPKGWSMEGAEKMARLRAFKANGGNVYDFMKEQKKEKKLYDITTKLLKETKKKLKQKKTAEIIGNIEVFKIGRITGLYKALKELC